MKPKKILILEAAFAVFSKKGFHKAKVEEIAEKAGVGKGTIYEYFRSKADLFQEMYKWFFERYFEELEAGMAAQTTAEEKINTIIQNHIRLITRFKGIASTLLSESGSHTELSIDFRQIVIKKYEEKLIKIKEIFDEGVNEGEFRNLDTFFVSNFFFGCLKGLAHSIMLSKVEVTDYTKLAEDFSDLLLNGLKYNGYGDNF